MSDGDKYCEENCNRKGDRGWWIREWDGLALSSIGWLDKTSLMWWQLKEVKEGSMGTSEHSKKREQWAWRLWSGNIYGASSSSREARVVRTEVKGRQVGDEDKGNRVGGQIICNSKLGAWSPDPPSMFFHFLFSEFFHCLCYLQTSRKKPFTCVLPPEGHTVQCLCSDSGIGLCAFKSSFMYLWASSPAFLCFTFFIWRIKMVVGCCCCCCWWYHLHPRAI